MKDKNNNIEKGKGFDRFDNPEQYDSDKESILDKFESEQTVDPLPMEDIREEKQEERAKSNTKDQSSSERKYDQDYN
ncbi:hypothetical protein FZC78_07065 [Rossellomorea vietnamensis]|uniref:Uncharacterized protein n=1 Tax=Rossellomorea vietnamensis TaxID=218284 RepID=A0A5D4NWB4_9BACI|nr:hypothetical protein [Rossellomorea vietnamensis]TYS17616.1 hypothetical protein FZC78_07065 [Rossellomorea vietnamensis]